MPETIEISSWHLWVVAKFAIAVILMKWEIKHPVWDKDGNERGRTFLELMRRFAFHCILNPELSIGKALLLLPLSFFKGPGILDKMKPIKIQNAPYIPKCRVCDDTGYMKMHDKTLRGIPCSCKNNENIRSV